MRSVRPAPPDRRNDDGLSFDPVEGVLELGAFSVVLPPGRTNADVLQAYVDLATRCRGGRVAALYEVRQSDAYALCIALDLDAGDLAAEIERILGASREQASGLVSRLRGNRVIGGIAAAATGTAVAAALTVAGPAGAQPAPAHHLPAAVAPASPEAAARAVHPARTVQPGGAPIVVGPGGVGLIPPLDEGADGVGLIPPATVDAPAPRPRRAAPTDPIGVVLIPPAEVDRGVPVTDPATGVTLIPPAEIDRPGA